MDLNKLKIISKKFISIAILLLFAKSSYSQQINASLQAGEVLKELINVYPGLSIAVGIGDHIVWKQGFGFADIDNNFTVNTNHQFRYYSLSKSITGIAIVKLIESKGLDIEQSIRYYLPDLPSNFESVKIKYLINHTSGLRNYKKGEWNKISNKQCDYTQQALNTFINDELISTPGVKYAYSSFGYVLLSKLIAVVSGQPFNEYVESNLLSPLSLENIAPDGSESLENEVVYYSKWSLKKSKGIKAEFADNTCKFGAGGFVGTAEDLAKLHLAMINNKIVSDTLSKLYYTGIQTSGGKSTNYAFGIGDATSPSGSRYHFHSGSGKGSNSALLIFPKSKVVSSPVVVVILGNIEKNEMNSKIGQIAALFIKEIPPTIDKKH